MTSNSVKYERRIQRIQLPFQRGSVEAVEFSDETHICKSPIVSVVMLTYKHATYLPRAIEGVLSQETDFDFELIVGEDCSARRFARNCHAVSNGFSKQDSSRKRS